MSTISPHRSLMSVGHCELVKFSGWTWKVRVQNVIRTISLLIGDWVSVTASPLFPSLLFSSLLELETNWSLCSVSQCIVYAHFVGLSMSWSPHTIMWSRSLDPVQFDSLFLGVAKIMLISLSITICPVSGWRWLNDLLTVFFYMRRLIGMWITQLTVFCNCWWVSVIWVY